MTWLQFLILALACWRLTLLVTTDEGPYGVFSQFRAFLSRKAKQEPAVRKSKVHEGIRCSHCAGQWLALPISAYVIFHASLPQWLALTGDGFLLWNALSACAIIINRIPEKK